MVPEKQINITIEVNAEKTHEDQRVAQIFAVLLDKVTVVLAGFAFELVVEVVASTVGCSMEVWKESWQRFEQGVLQTRAVTKLVAMEKAQVRRTLSG